jgi:Ca-activated chloride channel family protein
VIILADPWLLLLLPAPLVVRWILPVHRERRDALYSPFAGLLADLSGQRLEDGAAGFRRGVIQTLGFVVAWGLVVLALARPQLLGDPIERTVPMRDMLLAVDLSGSMATEDFTSESGKTVDRLTAVKEVLGRFLTGRQGDRVGLVFFGSAAFVQAPFTADLEVCQQLLAEAQVGMAGPRTMLGDAIGLAINTFEDSQVQDRVMILLTDGNDTGSRIPPVRAAAIAKDRGIVIHTVAVGDPAAAGEEALDERSLEQVSEETGGRYARAADRSSLDAVYTALDAIQPREVETISHRPRSELFMWPLGAFFVLTFLQHAGMALPRWLQIRSARAAHV